MKCLLVEDDQALARELRQALRDGDWLVEHAENGQEADFLVRTETYDTLILDVGLPDGDGAVLPQRRHRQHCRQQGQGRGQHGRGRGSPDH